MVRAVRARQGDCGALPVFVLLHFYSVRNTLFSIFRFFSYRVHITYPSTPYMCAMHSLLRSIVESLDRHPGPGGHSTLEVSRWWQRIPVALPGLYGVLVFCFCFFVFFASLKGDSSDCQGMYCYRCTSHFSFVAICLACNISMYSIHDLH